MGQYLAVLPSLESVDMASRNSGGWCPSDKGASSGAGAGCSNQGGEDQNQQQGWHQQDHQGWQQATLAVTRAGVQGLRVLAAVGRVVASAAANPTVISFRLDKPSDQPSKCVQRSSLDTKTPLLRCATRGTKNTSDSIWIVSAYQGLSDSRG